MNSATHFVVTCPEHAFTTLKFPLVVHAINFCTISQGHDIDGNYRMRDQGPP